MKTVDIICSYCNKVDKKPQKEIARRIRNGHTRFFCSLSCSTKQKNHELPNPQSPPPQYGNRYAKKGDFTWFLKKARERCTKKKYKFDLDEDYLQTVWTGKCGITGVEIHIRGCDGISSPFTASLDRIDSKKGYERGNVQFVAYPVNLAKNAFTDEDIRHWFQKVKVTAST